MNFWRGISTVIIWIVIGTTVTLAISNGMFIGGWATVAITAVSLIIGLVATLGIWVLPAVIEKDRPVAASPAYERDSKAKRGGNPGMTDALHALMSVMDDDERADFKAKLSRRLLDQAEYGSDGELGSRVSLADLLGDDDAGEKRLRR